MKRGDGLDSDNDIKNTLLSHLGAFISNSSKRNLNNFFKDMNGLCNNNVHYRDTDSL